MLDASYIISTHIITSVAAFDLTVGFIPATKFPEYPLQIGHVVIIPVTLLYVQTYSANVWSVELVNKRNTCLSKGAKVSEFYQKCFHSDVHCELHYS